VSTTSIEQTVSQYLNGNGLGGYANRVQPVVDNLIARERDMSEKLITYAVDQGANESEVRSYLEQIGMTVPSAEPFILDDDEEEEEAPSGDSDTSSKLDAIMARLDSLTAFARRNGYSGS
jgi:hypothetical protein